ncbi:hypothetical protein HDU67_001545 [Dinochytrium kinnereticum]|nr:hypothetical protein HDU67_001545 [Dinochytrium kinnereticum]
MATPAPAAAPSAAVDNVAPLSAEELQSIISTLSTKMKKFYILGEDIASQITAVLDKNLASGLYATLSPNALADQLTTDLRALNGDKHLRVNYVPTKVEEESDPALDTHEDDPNAEPTPMQKMFASYFELNGNGVTEVKRLKGNVGYLKLFGFASAKVSESLYAGVFEMLKHTNALIIDIRDTVGGDGFSSDLLISYLIDEKIDLVKIYWRPSDTTMITGTKLEVAGPKYLDKPVYVLVNEETVSACEKFAVCMQSISRATIIGKTTAGGGHPCTMVRIGHDHFSASISIGCTTSLITGKGWEGVGCIPDITTDEDPLAVAHRDAAGLIMKGLEACGESLSMFQRKLMGEVKGVIEGEKKEEGDKSEPAPTPRSVGEENADSKYGPGVHIYQNADGTYTKRTVKEFKLFGVGPKFHIVNTLSKEDGEAALKKAGEKKTSVEE